MKNIIESLFGIGHGKAIDEKYGEYYGGEAETVKCCNCGKECDPMDIYEAEIHENGKCLHIPATENYTHELGEGYIFADKECTERFCMEFILGLGYPRRIESSLGRTIIDMVKMRINILRELESSIKEIPRETDKKLWAALGFMDNLNSYEEYKEQVREFCLDEDVFINKKV